MKRRAATEYFLLTVLTFVAGSVVYREHVAARSAPTSRNPAPETRTSNVRQQPAIKAVITEEERRVIRDYVISHAESDRYGNKGSNVRPLPAGLAKRASRKDLPLGWDENLVQGAIMPPEVFRECYVLPNEILAHLPPPPTGTVLMSIDGRVVRLVRATREILDVFDARI
jgi:hypothetical protein